MKEYIEFEIIICNLIQTSSSLTIWYYFPSHYIIKMGSRYNILHESCIYNKVKISYGLLTMVDVLYNNIIF